MFLVDEEAEAVLSELRTHQRSLESAEGRGGVSAFVNDDGTFKMRDREEYTEMLTTTAPLLYSIIETASERAFYTTSDHANAEKYTRREALESAIEEDEHVSFAHGRLRYAERGTAANGKLLLSSSVQCTLSANRWHSFESV